MKAGWEVKPLGAVCELIKRGIAPKYVESGGIVVINQKCIRDHRIDFDLARRNDLEKKAVPNERLIKLGDVLVNSTGTGTLGRVAQVRSQENFDATVDTHVTIVRPTEGKFYPPFFGYMMRMIEDEIKDAGQGVGGQTELSRDALTNAFSVSYPIDLEEQKRIVAVLDAAFEGLTRAKENAETNLQNARELFESYLNSCLKVAVDEFGSVEVTEFMESIVDCLNRTAPKSEVETPYKMVRTSNIRNGQLNLKSVNFVTEATYKTWTRRQVPKRGDVLLTREAPMGEAALVDTDDQIFLGQRVVSYRADSELLLPEFLLFSFLSKFLKDQFIELGSGSTVQHIRVPHTKTLKIPNVPVNKQAHLVEKLSILRAETSSLTERYHTKLQDIVDLRQSLLQKAFAGELT